MTTSGYAYGQLKRIKGHHKWINQPQPVDPSQQVDFISLVHNFTSAKIFKINLREYATNHQLIPFSGNTFGIYYQKGSSPFHHTTGALNSNFEGDSHEKGTPLFIIKFNKEVYESAKETWTNYWTWKKNRNKVRNELEEQHGYDCYTDDTEFLTSTGWKFFDEVSDLDTIATFNQQNHCIEYQLPKERIDSVYSGNLYNIKGHHVDTNVSANHWMYIRKHSRTTGKTNDNWELVRVAELPETFDTLNVISPKINRQLLPSGVDLSIFQHVCMLDYLRLLGWYISDGTLNFYDSGKVKSMMISQSKPQSKLTQTISKQINNGKIKCNKYVYEADGLSNHPENRWVFNSELSQLIFNDCGHMSSNKRLPNWVFFLTKREMTTLLVALLQGDGSKKDHQNHTYVYYTINSLLADDIQRLAFLCGFETSKYGPYPINSRFETNNDMYHVHINMRPVKTRRHIRSASVEKTPVINQRIVCFMVNNHTLVTRRNGQIGLHGNTKHASHLVRLLRMGAEALETKKIVVFRPDAEELLTIRHGGWTYEQLLDYAEFMDNHIKNVLLPHTDLPKTPNIKLASDLILTIQDSIWTRNQI